MQTNKHPDCSAAMSDFRTTAAAVLITAAMNAVVKKKKIQTQLYIQEHIFMMQSRKNSGSRKRFTPLPSTFQFETADYSHERMRDGCKTKANTHVHRFLVVCSFQRREYCNFFGLHLLTFLCAFWFLRPCRTALNTSCLAVNVVGRIRLFL